MNDEKGLLDQPLVVINVGLQVFAANLDKQQVEVIQVDWQPPAGGDQEMIELLDRLI
jgi:FdrA protein